jgi:hypothetical protein
MPIFTMHACPCPATVCTGACTKSEKTGCAESPSIQAPDGRRVLLASYTDRRGQGQAKGYNKEH